MDSVRQAFVEQLEAFGLRNDEEHTSREDRLLNITADTGQFLALLVKATRAKTILEIGTSNGYSTIWLADAVVTSAGRVITLEKSEKKAQMANENFRLAQLQQVIDMRVGPAEDSFKVFQPESFDFIFLDSNRSQYVGWWPQLLQLLKPGGLLVVDNAISHQNELKTFTAVVAATPNVETSLVPVGKGELLIWKPL